MNTLNVRICVLICHFNLFSFLHLFDIMDRSMTPYELRACIRQRDEIIQRLKQEIQEQSVKNKQLRDWNVQWQTRQWDIELAKQCHAISKEFQKLSEPRNKDHEVSPNYIKLKSRKASQGYL